MAHFTVGAIYKVDDPALLTKYDEEYNLMPDNYIAMFSKMIEKPFARFDLNKEMPPWKRYINPVNLKRMQEYYKTEDLAELAKHMQDWDGSDGGADEKGLYGLTKDNPEGKYDYANVFGVFRSEFLSEHLEEDRIPRAMLTPQMEWVEGVTSFNSPVGANEKFDAWVADIRKLLAKYPNSLVALIDCHY